VSETTATAYSVQVVLRSARGVEVNDYVHGPDIDASCVQISRDENPGGALGEVMKNFRAVFKGHLRMHIQRGNLQLFLKHNSEWLTI